MRFENPSDISQSRKIYVFLEKMEKSVFEVFLYSRETIETFFSNYITIVGNK